MRYQVISKALLAQALTVSAAVCSVNASVAEPLWHSESISVLHGDNFKISPPRQTTLTLQHASGWAWGDVFGFVDTINYRDSGRETGVYGEITPRLSLSWLTGAAWSAGPVSDTFAVIGYESGRGDVETLLAGVGFSFTAPRFNFLQLNIVQRFPDGDRDGNALQITPSASYGFSIGDTRWVIDGYIDWVVDSDGHFSKNLHINPQLKLDLGKVLMNKTGQLWFGVEYDYWSNKYGIENSPSLKTDQSALSALLQVRF